MAAFALQGTHPSTGSGQRQVCGRLWMSLVDPALMVFFSGLPGEGAASPPSSEGEAVLPLLSTKYGGGALPFRPQLRELRGRGQRHLLAPSTRSGTLEGGYWGARDTSSGQGCVSDTSRDFNGRYHAATKPTSFLMSLVKPALMGFLWPLLLCRV